MGIVILSQNMAKISSATVMSATWERYVKQNVSNIPENVKSEIKIPRMFIIFQVDATNTKTIDYIFFG